VKKLKKQLPKRHELDVKHTWDMTNLFKTEVVYQEAFDLVEKDVESFCTKL
jgi:oligoendopeptidase F